MLYLPTRDEFEQPLEAMSIGKFTAHGIYDNVNYLEMMALCVLRACCKQGVQTDAVICVVFCADSRIDIRALEISVGMRAA